MEELSSYTFCNRDYFDTLGRFPITSVYSDLLASLLPRDWKLTRFDVYLQASSGSTVLKPQGFKIHVSATSEGAEAVLRKVVPECVRANVTFKVVADPLLLRFMNSKRYARGGSGKFVTIYPPDEATFLSLIEALNQATRELEGPYILSDRRYPGSKVVFYRYGAFQRMSELLVDGTRRAVMRKPDGTVMTDSRMPFFQLPEGVKDPIPAPADEDADDGGLLNGRYEVQESLSFTNTGGVYKALDHKTGRTVVIKEARPHTETWMGVDLSVDSLSALRWEHDNLQRLQGLACVPELIELYQEWEHTFLVVAFFDGLPLAKLRAREEFIVMSHMDDPAFIARFCESWRLLLLRLLDAVESIHARGLIVGDISPGNVLMNPETGALGLIDLEGAMPRGESSTFATQWFNPGFRKVERRQRSSLEPFDDYYACGMLLYNLICPIQNLFELDKSHPTFRILDHFIEAGLPSQVRGLLQALLEGRAADARAQAEAWQPSNAAPLTP
ncbi:protein kinase domain-containing protein [Myxococcus sp. 1LA]